MSRPVRIGNAISGFWGDRLDAAREMLALEPELDFLTLDFLAEVSMSILALQRSRDPEAGWPRDFVEIVRSIAPYWRERRTLPGHHQRRRAESAGLCPGVPRSAASRPAAPTARLPSSPATTCST